MKRGWGEIVKTQIQAEHVKNGFDTRCFHKRDNFEIKVDVCTDTDFAGDVRDMKHYAGCTAFLNGSNVDGWSRKSVTATTSPFEAENAGGKEAAKEGLATVNLTSEFLWYERFHQQEKQQQNKSDILSFDATPEKVQKLCKKLYSIYKANVALGVNNDFLDRRRLPVTRFMPYPLFQHIKPRIHFDNQSNLFLNTATNPTNQAKHFLISQLYVRQLVANDICEQGKIPSEVNTADMGTKPLAPQTINFLSGLCGIGTLPSTITYQPKAAPTIRQIVDESQIEI